MRQKAKQLMGILLSLVMVLGLMPGMSLTAFADDPYASLKNTTTVVHFDSKDWYLIDYDSSTVTLLAKECVAASQYNSSGTFAEYSNNPTVKTAVDNYYNSISADAKTAVSDGMFLLTIAQANTIAQASAGADVLRCNQFSGTDYNGWWLCSRGVTIYGAAGVSGVYGYVPDLSYGVMETLGVRPALQLDLNMVEFDSTTNTFSLATLYPLWVGGTQVTSANAGDVFGDGKVKYTPATDSTPATLTLSGVTISTYDETNKSGILYTGSDDLNIVLSAGSVNTIKKDSATYIAQGINCTDAHANVTISGTGELSIFAEYNGILTTGKLTIQSGKIDATVTCNQLFAGTGILSFIRGVTIDGGTVNVTANRTAISAASGDVTINGGTVTLSGNMAENSGGIGILAKNVKINGGTVTAKGEFAGIHCEGSVEIAKDVVSVIAFSGNGVKRYAIYKGTVKNAIPGIGWTDSTSTGAGTPIPVNTTGASLSSYEKVQFLSHIHSFIYSVGMGENANTITATCANTDGKCTLSPSTQGGSDHVVKLTIITPTLITYGGTGIATASLDGADDFSTTTGLTVSSAIDYYKATKSGDTYTKGDKLDAAPTDAGDYLAEITVEGATASVGYTVAPKTVNAPTINVTGGPYTYTGSQITATVEVKDGDTLIDPSEYTVGYKNNLNVGTATITIADKDGGN